METLKRCCCFSFFSLTSENVDIVLMVVSGLSFYFSFLTLVIIKWKYIDKTSLGLMLIIFFLCTFLFFITTLIFHWRKKGIIKSSKKEAAKKLTSTGIIISVIIIVFCIISNIVFSADFSEANHPCSIKYIYIKKSVRNLSDDESDDELFDCSLYSDNRDIRISIISTSQYFIAYFSLTLIEIAMIISILLWRSSNIRIITDIDGIIEMEEKEEEKEERKEERQQSRHEQGKPVVINQPISKQIQQQTTTPQQVIIQQQQPSGPVEFVIRNEVIIQPQSITNNNLYQYPSSQQSNSNINNAYTIPIQQIPQRQRLPPIQESVNSNLNGPGYNYPRAENENV